MLRNVLIMTIFALLVGVGVLIADGRIVLNIPSAETVRVEKFNPLGESEVLNSYSHSNLGTVVDVRLSQMDLEINSSVSDRYPRPVSEWKEGEKSAYKKLLGQKKYDLMVVPVTVNSYSLSRSIRSYMTAELAYAISHSTSYKVPDPYLLMRVLGDGERSYELDDVIHLSKELGVKKILWISAGRTAYRHIKFKGQMLEATSGEGVPEFINAGRQNFEFETEFTDWHAPLEVFNEKLSWMLDRVGIKLQAVKDKKTLPIKDLSVLSNDPTDVYQRTSSNRALNAYCYQYLAYVTPENEERVRERFIEKSLIEINKTSRTSPYYKALKARAYMFFGLRAAAMHVIGSPATNEEKAVLASLNGDLNQLRELIPTIKSPLGKVFAQHDANRIDAEYSKISVDDSERSSKLLGLTGEVWSFLNNRAFTEWDEWRQFNNLHIKQLLDRMFPIPEYTAENLIEGAVALNDLAAVRSEIDLSVVEHIGKLINIRPDLWCCDGSGNAPRESDLIELLGAIATDNLMRRAEFLVHIQASPDRASKFLDDISAVYRGYPRYALYRAYTQLALANKAHDIKKEKLIKSSYVNAVNALYWSNGQTRVSADVYRLRTRLGRNDFDIAYNLYVTEYPYKPFYPNWTGESWSHQVLYGSLRSRGRAILHAEDALRNATYHFGTVKRLSKLLKKKIYSLQLNNVNSKKYEAKLRNLFDSIKDRFDGNPEYLQLMAKNSLDNHKYTEAEEYYRKGIKEVPEYLDNYMSLGLLLFELGRVDEAFHTLKQWSGFIDNSSENKVKVANAAFDAGSFFYWGGYLKYAKHFYEIASTLDTGSYSSITAQSRLHLIDKDYGNAIYSIKRHIRYNSINAYRDYIGMLHARGDSEKAWSVFNAIVSREESSKILDAAIAGQRIAALTSAEVYQWALKYKNLITQNGYGLAAIHLLREGIIDRTPSAELIGQVRELDSPVWQMLSHDNDVLRMTKEGDKLHYVGPYNIAIQSFRKLDILKSSDKAEIKSDLVYFAEAYRALKIGAYKQATLIFEEMKQYYDEANANVRYILPYYAYTAFKSGDVKELKEFINSVPDKYKRFDYHLTQAVLYGLDGDYKESEHHLGLARVKSPYREKHQGERPVFIEYQYAEICELLYLATNRNEYKELLLSWSRTTQVFIPWYSWSYSMVAKYSSDPDERGKSIAIGYFLDRNSERLKNIPTDEVSAALNKYKDMFESNGPFVNGKFDDKFI